jgi:hypothetical protein
VNNSFGMCYTTFYKDGTSTIVILHYQNDGST